MRPNYLAGLFKATMEVVPSLVASRLSGVAPLAVLFDATGTTSTSVPDSFRQVLYTYDFGDPSSGVWATDGTSKNVVSGGPIGAHVFDSPGTYTVTLIANDGAASKSVTVTITVLDPEVFYAGKTICVSTDGSTGWGPAGATYTTTIPDLSSTSPYAGYRILFKRGQDFSADNASSITITTNVQDLYIGAAGSGARPIVQGVGLGSWRPNLSSPMVWPDRIVVADLYMKNGYTVGSYGSNQLIYRCTSDPSVANSSIGWGTYWMYDDPYQFVSIDQWVVPKYHFIVECDHPGDVNTQNYNIFGSNVTYAAIMGSTMGAVYYHNLRLTSAYKTLVSHNVLQGISNNASYHTFKLHGQALTAYPDNLTSGTDSRSWATRYVVAQYNTFGSVGCPFSWIVAVSPENSTSAQGVEDCAILNNSFIRNPTMEGSQTDLVMGGRRISYIGNTGSTGTFTTATGHDEALPADWKGPYYSSRV